jgi:hypothetical protein
MPFDTLTPVVTQEPVSINVTLPPLQRFKWRAYAWCVKHLGFTDIPMPRAILIAARVLIEHEEDWTIGQKVVLDPFSGGLQYCALGALETAADRHLLTTKNPNFVVAKDVLTTVAQAFDFTDIPTMNDKSSHKFVLHAFDVAIRYAPG